METVLDVINICPSTKREAELFATKLSEMVLAGETNPLALFVKINALQKALSSVKETIDKETLAEAQKYGAKEFEAFGAKVSVSELGAKYDFKNCGDIEWEMMDAEMSSLKERIKGRETFLKSIKDKITLVNEQTGEVYPVFAPLKSSTTGLKITLI